MTRKDVEKWEAKRGEIWNRVLVLGFKSGFWKCSGFPVRVTAEERRRQSVIAGSGLRGIEFRRIEAETLHKMSAILSRRAEK